MALQAGAYGFVGSGLWLCRILGLGFVRLVVWGMRGWGVGCVGLKSALFTGGSFTKQGGSSTDPNIRGSLLLRPRSGTPIFFKKLHVRLGGLGTSRHVLIHVKPSHAVIGYAWVITAGILQQP